MIDACSYAEVCGAVKSNRTYYAIHNDPHRGDRHSRVSPRRIQQARFRDADGSLDSFDLDFNKKMNRALIHELATGRFITQREDALLLGPPGTGKSHLAQALGRAAIVQGHRVLYAMPTP